MQSLFFYSLQVELIDSIDCLVLSIKHLDSNVLFYFLDMNIIINIPNLRIM